jgi:hypothetical protein
VRRHQDRDGRDHDEDQEQGVMRGAPGGDPLRHLNHRRHHQGVDHDVADADSAAHEKLTQHLPPPEYCVSADRSAAASRVNLPSVGLGNEILSLERRLIIVFALVRSAGQLDLRPFDSLVGDRA